jgi:tartrate-resistant acid phosphatase type 5
MMRPLLALLLLVSALTACGDSAASAGTVTDGGLTADAGPEGVIDAGSNETPDAGPTDPADAGEVTDAGEALPDAGPVDPPDPGNVVNLRFVALGDQGDNTAARDAIAVAMQTVCAAKGGCDLGLLLGDNFYNTGVSDANDAQFVSKFETPYGPLGFTFYPTLGNHDYGGEGAGYELYKGQAYVEYGLRNPQWVMPSAYHHFTHGPVDFYDLDTTAIFWGLGGDQRQWLPGELAKSTRSWKIAYGHHPYRSNGPHGNAGAYEDISWAPVVNGRAIKDFVEDQLCGKVDVYLCGHDHSLQDLGRVCGTEFLVSGAGAKTTELENRNTVPWMGAQPDNKGIPGFLLVEASPRTLTFTFYDQNAAPLHTRTLTK